MNWADQGVGRWGWGGGCCSRHRAEERRPRRRLTKGGGEVGSGVEGVAQQEKLHQA